ncbi:hypothetical protein Bbelb_282570 [Branchiostoma belcheri]|nr:hypothetical protein Bbelb_282570 [Branchiostoma belcheri]
MQRQKETEDRSDADHDNIIHYGPEEDIEANIFTHNDGFRSRSPDTVHFSPLTVESVGGHQGVEFWEAQEQAWIPFEAPKLSAFANFKKFYKAKQEVYASFNTSPTPVSVQERNVYYSQTCVVCLENPPVEVVWPCRHACLCRPCAGRLKILSSRCPEDPESEAERRSWEEFQEDMAVLDSLNRIMGDPGKSEEQNAEARRKYEDYVRKTTEHSLVVCSDGTTFGGGHHPRGMVFDNRVRSRVEEAFSVEELRQNNVYGDPRRGYGVMDSNRIQAITEHLVAIEGTPTSAEDQAFKPRILFDLNFCGVLHQGHHAGVAGGRTTPSEECCSICQEEENAHEGAYMLHPRQVFAQEKCLSMANLEEEMDHVWDYFATTDTQLVTQIHCPGATPAAESSKATVIESVETAKHEPQTVSSGKRYEGTRTWGLHDLSLGSLDDSFELLSGGNGSLEQGSARCGYFQHQTTRHGGLEQGSLGAGGYQLETTRPGEFQRQTTRHGGLEQGSSGAGGYQLGTTRPGEFQRQTTRHGGLEQGSSGAGGYQLETTRPGEFQRETTRLGAAGEARFGMDEGGLPPRPPLVPVYGNAQLSRKKKLKWGNISQTSEKRWSACSQERGNL